MNNIVPVNNSISEAFPLEKEVMSWNLEEAIQRVKPKVESFKRSAQDLAKDLFIAHEALARMGGDRRSENAPVFTWSDFCDVVGLSRKTATLYCRLYDPVQDRVLDPEEIKPLKTINPAELEDGHEARVAHAMATGERLAGWTQEDEKEYKKRKANEHFAELADKWGKKKIKTRTIGRDYFSEAIGNAKQFARFNLQTKEQSLAQFELFDELTAYLKTFDDPATRLAAGYNIGLRVREIINDMASQFEELAQFDSVEVED